jgi:DNA-binding GntR family transcriptional regulator
MPHAPSPILVRFQATTGAMPKHARLRRAIIDAVRAGELPAGTKVMGERELSAALGLSLGTTQKALGQLMNDGFLVRRQGHGTFVGSERRPIAGSWHFRFVPPEGGPELPVFARIVERGLVKEDGPWTEALGADPKGYVMVRRCLDIGGEFKCASRMYLRATRFARLLRMAESRLADTNLKFLLAQHFAAPTLHSEGLATVAALEAEDAALVGVRPATVGLRIDIVGRSFGHEPFTYQRVAIPPTRWALKLDFNPPGTGGSAGPAIQKE